MIKYSKNGDLMLTVDKDLIMAFWIGINPINVI